MLLNLNPLPANTPVTGAPLPPGNGTNQPLPNPANSRGDGFLAVFQRETASPTGGLTEETSGFGGAGPEGAWKGNTAAADAADADLEGSVETETFADVEATGIVVPETGVNPLESAGQSLSGFDGMMALIEEMTFRPDLAVADGRRLPLPDALDALADAIDDLTGMQIAQAGEAASGRIEFATSVDTGASPLPATVQGILAGIGARLGSFTALTTETGRSAGSTPSDVSNLAALAGMLRDAGTLLRQGEVLGTVPASQANAAPLVTDSLLVTEGQSGLARLAAVFDLASLQSALTEVRTQVRELALAAGHEPEAADAPGLSIPNPAAAVSAAPVMTAAEALPKDPAAVTATLVGAQLAGISPDVLRAGRILAMTGQHLQTLPPDALDEVSQLLDDGFELIDPGSRSVRELVGTTASVVESLTRATGLVEPGPAGADAGPTSPATQDRPVPAADQRPAMLGGKADVWLAQPAELPEHILQHVNRLHAQSARLHAAGFTDLMQRLTLTLFPEELGQVDVQLRTGDQMSLNFIAREPATRDLLEQNLPRLRQLFESQGLSLGDVNVGSGQAQQRQGNADGSALHARETSGVRGDARDRVTGTAGQSGITARDRLIDVRA